MNILARPYCVFTGSYQRAPLLFFNTMMMRMQRENPTLRAMIDKSLATAREWAQIDIEENERTAVEAFSRATTARTILGGAK
jgi:hypothetical protein